MEFSDKTLPYHPHYHPPHSQMAENSAPICGPIDKPARTELSISVRSKIRALRSIAEWPFRKIGTKFGIPYSTVFRVCNQVCLSYSIFVEKN